MPRTSPGGPYPGNGTHGGGFLVEIVGFLDVSLIWKVKNNVIVKN